MKLETRRMNHRHASDRAGSPEAIAERLRYRAIEAQVNRERDERYPVLTVENAAEVIAWQTARVADLKRIAEATRFPASALSSEGTLGHCGGKADERDGKL